MNLLNSFFMANSCAAGYKPNTVIVNLTGASSFTEDTVFKPGKYRIQIAPGLPSWVLGLKSLFISPAGKLVYIDRTETITKPFFIRAYCGSDAVSDKVGGTNPYSGPFKVNAVNALSLGKTMPSGISVNHIFGAGGGNAYIDATEYHTLFHTYSGGGNCLGNGACVYKSEGSGWDSIYVASGAGSCLHLLPTDGVFGTDYIRAYHVGASAVGWTSYIEMSGSTYGGAAGASVGDKVISGGKGGNSPYGAGGSKTEVDISGYGGTVYYGNGTGVGCGTIYTGPKGAVYDGAKWIDVEPNTDIATGTTNVKITDKHSLIKITYLGEL